MEKFTRAAVRSMLGAMVAALATAGVAHAQTRDLTSRGEQLDRIAAIVNDGVVLSSELDDEFNLISERLKAQKLDLPPDNVLRKQVLDELVIQQIEMQAADHAGIKIPDEALNNALTEVAQRNGMTLSQLPDALAAQGIDYAGYRDAMRKELTISLLRERQVIQHISVTSREIDRYLDHAAKNPSDTSEFKISHILIAVPENATADQLAQAGERAADVYKRAKAGEDFAKLAISYSNSSTALQGGSLGWRKGTELPTFLADMIPRMKPGDVSAPLRTPTGFNIVKLDDTRSAEKKVLVDQIHARHILMRTNELQDDATVRQKLESLRERIMKGEDFGGLAATNSQDPGSASDGGDLGWSPPDAFAPEFAAALDQLKVGEVSEPFHTRYGWSIAEVLGRRKVDSTDELKRKSALDAIKASKADEDTELWLRHLRDDAYVEYKM